MKNKKLFYMILFLLLCLNILAKEKIVVLPFSDEGKSNTEYSYLFNSIIEEKLIKIGEYEILNRVDLDKIMEEQKMSLLGIIDENTAVEIGKVISSKKAIIGNIESKSNNKIKVIIKIIDLESSKLERVFNISSNLRDLNKANIENSLEDCGEKFYYEYLNEKKLRYFFKINYGLMPLSLDKYKNYNSKIKIYKNTENPFVVSNSLGIKYKKTSFYTKGEYYLQDSLQILKFGIGVNQRIKKIGKLNINTGFDTNTCFIFGEIGETMEISNYGEKVFSQGSKITANTNTIGIVPYIELEYFLSKHIILNTKLAYEYYKKIDNLDEEIEDRYDSDKANIDIEDFYDEISLSGVNFGLGVKFVY